MLPRRAVSFLLLLALVATVGAVEIGKANAAVRPMPNGTLYEKLTVSTPDCRAATNAGYCKPPPNALYVSTSGNDASGNGSVNAPFRTVGKAIAVVPRGGTLVIRQGVYREGNFKFFKPITLQSFPGEQVWLKGSEVVASSRFTRDNGQWRMDGYNPGICRPKPDDESTGKGCAISEFAPDVGMAQWPDMVFVNGVPLEQVGTRAAATAGKFYVDAGAQKLYIGNDPAGQTVEVATRSTAMTLYGPYTDGTSVKGIGFAQYASVQNYANESSATVISMGTGTTLSNNTFAFGASTGVMIGGPKAKISNNTFIYNGFNGLNGNEAHDAEVINNRVAYNNREQFHDPQGAGSAEAGSKWAHSNGVTVRDNLYEYNAKGFWCDLECVDWTFVGNNFRHNDGAGAFFEVSKGARFYSNIFQGNGGNGLQLVAENVAIVNNTFVDNQQAVAVWEDGRIPGTSSDAFSRAIYANTRNVRMKNNIFSGFNARAGDDIWGRPIKLVDVDGLGEADSAPPSVMVTELNYNLYNRPLAKPVNAIGWAGGCSNKVNYPNRCNRAVNALYEAAPSDRLRSETGREANGWTYNATSPDLFANKANGDFRLAAGSFARNKGGTLSADIASAIGVAPTAPVSLGALRVRGVSMVSSDSPPSSQLRLATSNNLSVDVSFGAKTDGALIIQYRDHGGPNQRWIVSPVASAAGYFTIVGVGSSKCLDAAGTTASPGDVRQWTCNGSAAQMWKLNPTAATAIVNRSTGLVLDIPRNSAAQEVRIRQMPHTGSAAQTFTLS